MVIVLGLTQRSVRAQPDLGLTLKGGPNVATVDIDHREGRHGFSGGLAGYLQWSLVDRYSLAGQMELLYTPRGAEAVFEGEYLGKVRQHYFDITVAARPEARLGRGSLYLLLGGGLSFLLSANQENASGVNVDVTGVVSRLDVTLLVGAGVGLRLPHQDLGPFRLGSVFLEARHDRGMVDIDTVNGGSRNRTTSLMVGLSIVLASGDRPPRLTSPAAEASRRLP